MKLIVLSLAVLCTTVVTSPVWAAQTLSLPSFDDIGVKGSATVAVRPGVRPQVIVREGDIKVSDIRVERWGSLVIHSCRSQCPPNYRLVVDVIMPRVGDLAVSGSGRIRVAPGFDQSGSRDFAVSGSGMIDASQLSSDSMEIAVSGSGQVHVGTARRIQAAISGSGSIGYAGNPDVQQVISGSGRVGPDR